MECKSIVENFAPKIIDTLDGVNYWEALRGEGGTESEGSLLARTGWRWSWGRARFCKCVGDENM